MLEGGREHQGGPSSAIRPHWWTLLAVCLGLMALVSAISTQPSPTASRQIPAGGRGHGAPLRSGATDPVPTNGASGPSHGEAVSADAPSAAVSSTEPVVPQQSSRPASSTTTSIAPPIPPPSPAPPSPDPPAVTIEPGTQSFSGGLDYPLVNSANYSVTVHGGVLRVGATWAGGHSLALSALCPGGQATTDGPTGLALSLAAGAGSCSLSVALVGAAPDQVNFVLTATDDT